jgi:NADH:ubiquinone oxidoreductase subunit 6 (subunit J)
MSRQLGYRVAVTQPSPSTPRSDGDRLLLKRAAELHRPLARAAKLSRGNGLGYVVFGGLSLVFAVPGMDLVGMVLGAILLGVGMHERVHSGRILHGEVTAPLQLARGELVLLAAIVVYGVLGLTVLPSSAQTLEQQFGHRGTLGMDIQRIADSVTRTWYAVVIAVAVLYQGGMARYFHNRRPDVVAYLSNCPAWAREIVETMTS